MRFRLNSLLIAALLGGCAEHRMPGPPPEQSTARTAPSAAPSATAVDAPDPSASACIAPPEPPRSWADCIRLERWDEAAAQLDALPEDDAKKAEVRYARGRVAIALGDFSKAVTLLTGLDAELPLIANDVARFRAEAELEAGPFADAATYFAKSTKVRDLARAAAALVKAGDLDGALRQAERAVQAGAKTKQHREEAIGRMARAKARKAKGLDAAAEVDLRWIAVNSPATAEGLAAAAELEKAKHPLNDKERSQAIDKLLDAASPAAVGEINRVSADAKSPESLHARATALFRARAYADAAKAFDAAAASGRQGAVEDLFDAGRSLQRIGDDEGAVNRFNDVVTKYKTSPFAERASYYIARIQLQGGKFDDAAASYGKYLSAFRKGTHKSDAEYERALALLSSSTPREARIALGKLEAHAHGDEVGRIRELEGLAALRDGDKDLAISIWTDLVKTQPLTWAALTSRARLATVGAPLPPVMDTVPSIAAMPLDVKLPAAPALLHSIGLDGDAEGYLAQSEHQIASQYAGREGEALCSLYGMLSQARRRFRIGNAKVHASTLMRTPAPNERWAWECVYPQPYDGNVREIEESRSLPHGFIYALMRQESAFDPAVVSPASAIGLMQLMPATAKQVASELASEMGTTSGIPIDFDASRLTSPVENIKLGAFYVQKLLKMFQSSMILAAAAYNAGPRPVSHWVEVAKDAEVDLFVARIPYDETRNYVAKVMGNLARYQWLAGGDSAVTSLSLELPQNARAPADAY